MGGQLQYSRRLFFHGGFIQRHRCRSGRPRHVECSDRSCTTEHTRQPAAQPRRPLGVPAESGPVLRPSVRSRACDWRHSGTQCAERQREAPCCAFRRRSSAGCHASTSPRSPAPGEHSFTVRRCSTTGHHGSAAPHSCPAVCARDFAVRGCSTTRHSAAPHSCPAVRGHGSAACRCPATRRRFATDHPGSIARC
jgi:hypothetical protein